MTTKNPITFIMRQNIYSLIKKQTGKPPYCKICEEESVDENGNKKPSEIKVGDKYVHKNTRLHKYGAFYCMKCAKEKCVI